MLKPSSRQVLATLAIQRGFCPIKYSKLLFITRQWGNRVTDGISNHLIACEAEPDG